jgi:prolyl-tRNA synthetase
MEEKKQKVTFRIDKGKDFSGWYNEILSRAEIVDKRYPIKGMDVLLPYGYGMHENIMKGLERILNENEHQKLLMPSLIPEEEFKKEAQHVKGFEGEVFWVTHGGLRELDMRLLLRPTSEVPLYHMFALWIRSHTDLPLKVYQTCTIFRYETKATKPLIRVREIPWNEAHTAHTRKEEAELQIQNAWKHYLELIQDCLGITGLVLTRPVWDKFPGAEYTTVMDALMPDGRVLQIAGIHNLGQNFSRIFDITYEDAAGKRELVYQTCYGVSTRLLAATLSIHGDNHGLNIPFPIAPLQVVIIPIIYKGTEQKIMDKCIEIEGLLRKTGIRVKVDDDLNKTPGDKFYFWEMKGIPIRIEIGPKELDNKELTVFRRDTRKRARTSEKGCKDYILKLGRQILKSSREKSKKDLKKGIRYAGSLEELKEQIDKIGGFVKIPFCNIYDMGGNECADEIKQKTTAEIRGVLYPKPEIANDNERCLLCGRQAKHYVYVAKAY